MEFFHIDLANQNQVVDGSSVRNNDHSVGLSAARLTLALDVLCDLKGHCAVMIEIFKRVVHKRLVFLEEFVHFYAGFEA